MLRLATWLRIGGVVALASASGSFLAFFAGQETAEAHNVAPVPRTALEVSTASAASTLAPVRVVYHAPIVASADRSRSAAPSALSSIPPKLHIERAPSEAAPPVGTRLEKPPLRVGYRGERSVSDQAAASTGTARGSGTLDLNRATSEELDKLPGDARIGKAIVRGRPYSAPDDLVRKRVLTKEAFARIQDQVAVAR